LKVGHLAWPEFLWKDDENFRLSMKMILMQKSSFYVAVIRRFGRHRQCCTIRPLLRP
jgi:hypothetical protein